MSGPRIRGWCPGAHRPMLAGDGLVVRVRPPMGQLSPRQALGLAALAETHANGSVELTSRANLQLRGVSLAGHAPLLAGLAGLDLISPDAESEGRHNIILDPFRTGDEPDSIARGIAEGLPRFRGLPEKFGFALDCGPLRHLAEVSADIRVESSGPDLIVRADGCATGRAVANATEAALELAEWFIASGGVGADGRGRMARHLSATMLPDHLRGDRIPNPQGPAVQPGWRPSGICLAAGFGLLSSDDLRALAESGAPLLRMTPWRMVFLPIAARFSPPKELIATPHDPILRAWACTGAPGCTQASVQTRTLAESLARGLGKAERLHVSGCAKGCAHPGQASITLIGREGRFDLLRHGLPQATGLAPDDIQNILWGTGHAL